MALTATQWTAITPRWAARIDALITQARTSDDGEVFAEKLGHASGISEAFHDRVERGMYQDRRIDAYARGYMAGVKEFRDAA